MARKKNGSGYIYQRGQRYYGRLRDGKTYDGKDKIVSFSGVTRSEVKQKIAEYKANKVSVDGRTTVERYMTYWMKAYKLGIIKPTSYDRCDTALRSDVFPYIGSVQMRALNSEVISRLLHRLKNEKGLAYSSIKKVFDLLRSALDDAVYGF